MKWLWTNVRRGRALLNKDNAIRVEKHPRKTGGLRTVLIFSCTGSDCANEVRVRSTALKATDGRCGKCSHQKRPFESIYRGIFSDHRRIPVNLTYEEYLEFTKVPDCHYCGDAIPWTPYGTVDGKFKSRAYFLDRKDNAAAYSKDNCVVCCTDCNKTRSNRFTYEEFYEFSSILRLIKQRRKIVAS